LRVNGNVICTQDIVWRPLDLFKASKKDHIGVDQKNYARTHSVNSQVISYVGMPVNTFHSQKRVL
jgi:hypothetical protein